MLKSLYVPCTSAAFSKGIFAAATNSIEQTRQVVRAMMKMRDYFRFELKLKKLNFEVEKIH
jgi:hypothetical protein